LGTWELEFLKTWELVNLKTWEFEYLRTCKFENLKTWEFENQFSSPLKNEILLCEKKIAAFTKPAAWLELIYTEILRHAGRSKPSR